MKKIAGVDQDNLVDDPEVLADPDSFFYVLNGVKVHYKVYDDCLPRQLELNVPMILLHGFGASSFSWNRSSKPLAEATCSRILAFDRPAFGLTSRVDLSSVSTGRGGDDAKPINPYSMTFSVLTTLYFISFLASEKVVLIGHSAGSHVAVNTYFEGPERVAALILVAPAIVSPNPSHRVKLPRDEDSNSAEAHNCNPNLITRMLAFMSRILKPIGWLIMKMAMETTNTIMPPCKRVLWAILRSAFGVLMVRMLIDKFGVLVVKLSWHDQRKFTDDILQGYSKPLRNKGWDRALAEHTAALLHDPESKPKDSIGKRLHEISCPVLIITGDNDRIIPAWNSERLSRVIPGSEFKVIKQCGHLPHEEKADEFVSVVRKFLQRSLATTLSLDSRVSTEMNYMII